MWAITWRFLLAVMSVFLITVFSINFLPILQSVPNPRYHPSVFWLVATLFVTAISLFTSHGLVHAFFGKRLQLHSAFWVRVNHCLLGLFGFLAVFAFVMQAVSNPMVWANYKLYFQPIMLILSPLLAGSFMQHHVKHNNLQ